MRVPTSVARALLAYLKAGGPEKTKAEVMLNSMGWLVTGERAPQDVIDNARLAWATEDMKQQEIPL